ncbi:hypothetical protein [Jeongeupia naejangsanensis]|uniref:Fimbrial assembly protein n=1 Tax=Jeongeupia naejangsanensis TaxID=613195 RepID=A0ABS2BK27_9NEIS|nr:hypothetical protein [Jeongeupia naejangsanensis]MBM3115957.1 hypothetical protein [Jeongeupia naejangsanensis]
MNLPLRQDWPLLRGPLLGLLLAAVCGCGLAYAATLQRTGAQARLDLARERVSAMQLRVDETRTQLDQLDQHQRDYTRLRGRGVIGAEHRLEWAEFLEDQARRTPGLRYQIAARRALPGVEAQDGLQLFASRLDVRFVAADETGWSDFNAGLHRLPGWVAERRCQLERSASPDMPGVTIDCSYEWLSIDHASAEVPE